jgi:hypothetical protein
MAREWSREDLAAEVVAAIRFGGERMSDRRAESLGLALIERHPALVDRARADDSDDALTAMDALEAIARGWLG